MKFPKGVNILKSILLGLMGEFYLKIPDEFEPGEKFTLSGAMLVGDRGKIIHDSHGASGLRILPKQKMNEYVRPKKQFPE